MRGTKAKALRKAAHRAVTRPGVQLPDGFEMDTWAFYDARGTNRLGHCLRKLYQITKKNYKRSKRSHGV